MLRLACCYNTVVTRTFEYEGHEEGTGLLMSGRLEADDVDGAKEKLEAIGVDYQRLAAVEAVRPAGGRALSADEVVTFNEQLLHLTRAGLPLEEGLRLIAADMRPGKGRAVSRLADELAAGVPPAEAVARLGGALPPLYGRLLEAGAASGDLPGVLLGLGRHLTLHQRLRQASARALAYPAVLTLAVVVVGLVIATQVLPPLRETFEEFGVPLPWLTVAVLEVARWAVPVLIVVGVLVVLWPTVWAAMKAAGRGRWWVEHTLMRLPLVGPVVRYAAVARWLNAAAVAVRAGLDLPAGLRLANDATASPRLRPDGEALAGAVEAGRPLDGVTVRVLPTSVPAAMRLGGDNSELPRTLDTLAELYQRRAEQSVRRVPMVLLPLAVGVIAAVVGLLLVAMLLPMVTLIQVVSG